MTPISTTIHDVNAVGVSVKLNNLYWYVQLIKYCIYNSVLASVISDNNIIGPAAKSYSNGIEKLSVYFSLDRILAANVFVFKHDGNFLCQRIGTWWFDYEQYR